MESILGNYDTLADLTAAHPTGNIGDSYLVGDDLYVWNAADNNWVNVGNIKDSKGKTGKPRSARFIPLKEVARRVRKHPSTLRRWWEHDPPLFPRPRRTGPNSIAHVDYEVDEWILTRPEVGNEGDSALGPGGPSAKKLPATAAEGGGPSEDTAA